MSKPIRIRIIFPGPAIPENTFRKIEDLLPYQDEGVELSLSFNSIGPIHCQSDIENSLGRAGMPLAAQQAAEDGVDAIVIESMGDTGILECREAVSIPVVGMTRAWGDGLVLLRLLIGMVMRLSARSSCMA
jgi:allantoin racemase